MLVATPIYLLLLLPWAGVVAWVLFGRAEFARVSTTMFWEKTDTSTTTRRGIRRPPVWAVWMLVAMLAAILAASGLGVAVGKHRVVWIVDRNVMTIAELKSDPDLRDRIDTSNVVSVPQTGGSFDQATTLDTQAAIEQTVDRVLRESSLPVVVVTSQALRFENARVTVMRPRVALPNAGIDHFAVVTTPRPQAMVRVYNGTDAKQTTLRVDGVSQAIDLPPAGQTRDYFVDLPKTGDVIEAVLEIADAVGVDDRASLVRQTATPRLVPSAGMSEAVRRFVAVYEHSNPASPDAPGVAITDDPSAAGPVMILRTGMTAVEGNIRSAEHPVNQWIDWESVAPLIRGSLADPPVQGTPITWLGDRPIVAADAGRVEIGFDVSKLASRAEFVMLLGNATEFASGGRSEYASVGPGVLGQDWRRVASDGAESVEYPPGVYADGNRKRAVNVRAFRPSLTSPGPTPPVPEGGREVVSLGRALLVVSLAGVVAGLFCLTPTGRRVR